MQYNWYKKGLKQRLKYFEELKKSATGRDFDLICDTIDSIKSIFEPTTPIVPRNFDLASTLESDYLELSESRFLWPHIDGLASLPQFDCPSLKSYTLKLNNKDILDLIHDFFKEKTDTKTYQTFLYFWQQRKRNLHFINDAPDYVFGESFFLPYNKEGFVEIQKKNEFADLPTIVHEYGHLIQFFYNYSSSLFNSLLVFNEIVSTFFELISAEYFAKEELAVLGIARQKEYTFDIIDSAAMLSMELSVLQEISIASYQNRNDLRKNIDNAINSGLVSDYIWVIRDFYPIKDYPYLIAFYYASNLFMIYKNDPDRAFYLLYQIIDISLKLPVAEYAKKLDKISMATIDGTKEYVEYIKRKRIK